MSLRHEPRVTSGSKLCLFKYFWQDRVYTFYTFERGLLFEYTRYIPLGLNTCLFKSFLERSVDLSIHILGRKASKPPIFLMDFWLGFLDLDLLECVRINSCHILMASNSARCEISTMK